MDKENLVQLTKSLYRLTVLFPKREPLRCRIREAADDILAGFITKRTDSNGVALKENLEIIDSFFEIAEDQNWVSADSILEIRRKYANITADLEREVDTTQTGQTGVFGSNRADHDAILPETGIKKQPAEKTEGVVKEKPAGSAIQIAAVIPMIATSKPSQAFTEVSLEEDEEEADGEDAGGEMTAGQAARQQRIIEYLKEKGRAQVWEIQKIFPDISKRTIRRDFRSLLRQGMIERIGERNKTYYKLKINLS